jgi:hypothetical protein
MPSQSINLYTKHAHATNYISEAILCFVVMVMYCMLVLLVGILISLYCVTLVSSLIDNH